MIKDNTKISFSEYKIKATQADVASMKAHMKLNFIMFYYISLIGYNVI